MIDNLALAISHGLLALVVWRLMTRVDLDEDIETAPGEIQTPKKRSWLDRDA